ncbi:hypothetical protein QYM36_004493 [Artemia franciscana]|uniref:Reverse transcriptase domain-containing protein n=1 Tax=Artemia franciscana TaxID=6661 RepID=A0AA88I3Q6_ARTSF|nr:hypothetical protein QYM36_004493 [Artemia franciscana]
MLTTIYKFDKSCYKNPTEIIKSLPLLKVHQCSEGYGMTDSVFIKKALIDKYGKGKTCLYVGFLDLHKAFDSVAREFLKDVMLRICLLLLFVSLIVSMYISVSGIIHVGNRFLKLFDIKLRVKQGSTLSPKLFNIFINDVVNFLENRWTPKVTLGT